MTSSVDPKVYELAGAFVDDLLMEEPFVSRAVSEGEYDALLDRAATAMQQAVEDELAAIREEVQRS